MDACASDALHDVSWALEGSRDHASGNWAHTAWRLGNAGAFFLVMEFKDPF